MGRIAVAGAGAIGASIAYHLALRGARGVVLADPGGVAAGASGKAFGGIRQQFSTAAEVALARESVGFFRALGPALFQQVGYLFLATSAEGLAALEERRAVQRELGVELREGTRVEELEADVRVIACGAWSAEVATAFGAELPVRPLVRQLVATTAVPALPEHMP